MKEIRIDELKKIQLDILVKVRDFCENNNLQYNLAYGTLLGAIRHKGYIPWDDDIDIMMPRQDYNKFLKLFNGYYKELNVYAPEIDTHYYAPFANVIDNRTMLREPHLEHDYMGVKIDIFPMDDVPDDIKEYETVCEKSNHLNYIRDTKVTKLSYYRGVEWVKYFVKKIFYASFSLESVQKRIMKLARECDKNNSEWIDCIVFITIPNRRFPKSCFKESIKVPFENELFNVPADYDTCLKALFGNYMELPPVEKRILRHNFKASWR